MTDNEFKLPIGSKGFKDLLQEQAMTTRMSDDRPWREGRRHWVIGTAIALIGVVITAASFYQQYRHDHVAGPGIPSSSTSAASGGWGPDRPTFTMEDPPKYAVLNSITNNPNWGDERNFTRVRLVASNQLDAADMVRADIGDVVTVSVLVHNNCANDVLGSASSIHGLYMRYVPQSTGRDLAFQVFLGGNNVLTVYNGATVIVGEDAHLETVLGSAKMVTWSGSDAGFGLDAASIGRGENVLLGESGPDGEYPTGRIPGSDIHDYGAGYVEFQLRVVKGA